MYSYMIGMNRFIVWLFLISLVFRISVSFVAFVSFLRDISAGFLSHDR